MVSVADEQGRLVLMGVDATYCVVDEVDTTASTMHDHFLQQAIEDAESKVKQEPQSDDDGMNTDPELQENLPQTGSIHVEKGSLEESSEGTRQEVFRGSSEAASSDQLHTDSDSADAKTSVTNPSVLRAALLRQPVSLREPGAVRQQVVSSLKTAPFGSPQQTGTTTSTSKLEAGECIQVAHVTKPKIKRKSQSKSSTPNTKAARKEDQELYPSGNSEEALAAEGEKTKSAEEATGPDEKQEVGEAKKEKSKRSREKPYQCGVCERWFGCKSHVVEHMRTHTGEKPFECSLCHKRFSQKSNIYQHMNTHTQERPFRCNDCGKDFMYRGSLYKHKRLHTGERPYTCGLCQRRFTHASQLFEHLRTHTNERPFQCGVCGRAFAHSGTMHRHQRNHFSQLKGKTSRMKEVSVKDLEVKGAVDSQDGGDHDETKEAFGDINHNSESYTSQMDWLSTQRKETGDSGEITGNSVDHASDVAVLQDEKLSKLAIITALLDKNLTKAADSNVSHPTEESAKGSHGYLGAELPTGTTEQIISSTSPQRLTAKSDTSQEVSPASQPDSVSAASSHSNQTKAQILIAGLSGARQSSRKHKAKSPSELSKSKRTRVETEDRKVFSCNICGHSFCHKRSVKRHKLANHPDAADDGVVVHKAEVTDNVRAEVAAEQESEDSVDTRALDTSLLKSLLTLTASGSEKQQQGSSSVPDGTVLGVSPLGEASASLQAIAQICSQGHEGHTKSSSSSTSTHTTTVKRKKTVKQGKSAPKSPVSSEARKHCIKVEGCDNIPMEEDSVTTSTVKEAKVSDSGDTLHSVVVKLESVDDMEC